eukprot:CAMPEP_0195644810 /NCGR_PEP_ID=MMETSP0815-20121206/28594_1 /TAXON_ID=97485 /ORGANISM="Prymnesium parvum, Strain Texoma1" /LENGTH=47 /DNA_ID= /DNA_START= /DNA_END= /DNA_ORIENTATION=
MMRTSVLLVEVVAEHGRPQKRTASLRGDTDGRTQICKGGLSSLYIAE